MRLVRFASTFVAPVLVVATVLAEEPAPAQRLTVVAPLKHGLNVTGINNRGDVVGFHLEPENGDPNILYEAPIFARGGEIIHLPLLETYTATFPAAVSDDGVVVGRSSKPAPLGVYIPLRNQAFVWTSETGIRGLGAPDGESASLGTGVSLDGRRISGLSLNRDTPNRQGLIWERDGDTWKTILLPEADQINSNVLAISPDGKRLAAVYRLETSLWTEGTPGEWTRETIAKGADAFLPRAVNDVGWVVGTRDTPEGYRQAVVWNKDRGVETLKIPEGFVHAEASDVNNAGVVVGLIDGPHGEDVGPNAFVYENGQVRIFDEAGPDFVWATVINDAGQVAGILEQDEDEAAPAYEAGPEI